MHPARPSNCQVGEHVSIVPITFAAIGSHVCLHIRLITVTLSLYANNLNGTIPTELGLLSNLEDLELDTNRLIGTMPTSLASLSLLSKSQSLLFQYKKQFLYYGFSRVRTHPSHYRGSVAL